jgi:hypothetical protein
LQPLCAKHNLSKGTKTMTEWRKDGLDWWRAFLSLVLIVEYWPKMVIVAMTTKIWFDNFTR